VQLLASDWGLLRTVRGTIESTRAGLARRELDESAREMIHDRLTRGGAQVTEMA
jgi:hypothetical protein